MAAVRELLVSDLDHLAMLLSLAHRLLGIGLLELSKFVEQAVHFLKSLVLSEHKALREAFGMRVGLEV
jgi:hypothetical protein